MDKGLFDAYLQSFYRGKSRFARGVDALSLFVGTLMLAFYLLKSVLVSTVSIAVLSLLTAAFALSVKCGVSAYMFLGHIDKLRSDTKKRIFKRKLLLAPKADLGAIVAEEYPDKEAVIIQTAKEIGADSIYGILRENGSNDLVIASVSAIDADADEARVAIESVNAEFVLFENIPAINEAYAISDSETDNEIIESFSLKNNRHKLKGAALSLKRALVLALVLTVFCTIAPYLRYGGYLRTLAVFVFSALTYRGMLTGAKEVKTRLRKAETS